MARRNEGVAAAALALAVAALRGALALLLVRAAKRVFPAQGVVADPADETPTAPIRPPRKR
jgi:hypothetical protein